MEKPRTSFRPWLLRGPLIGLGTILVAVAVTEMYVWWVVRSIVEPAFVAGLLMSLSAAGLLIAGGYWLPKTTISVHRYPKIGLWTLAGTLVLGSFSVLTGTLFFPDLPWAQIGSVRWGVAIGSGVGFLIGGLNARAIERAVDAERASIRAEASEQHREFLDYMNALLRHEVLNTANVIAGYAGLLEERLDADDDAAEYAAIIDRQAAELTRVIEDARLLIQIAEGGQETTVLDLRQLLTEELEKVSDRHPDVETSLEAPDAALVEADHLVRRVFSNLLENAVKHNHGESKRVAVAVTQTDDRVRVTVEDNGLGVPAEKRDDLFDLAISREANHGLGLTIAARLVDRYDGTIELARTGEDGTVVAVTLPRARSARSTDAATTGAAPSIEAAD